MWSRLTTMFAMLRGMLGLGAEPATTLAACAASATSHILTDTPTPAMLLLKQEARLGEPLSTIPNPVLNG